MSAMQRLPDAITSRLTVPLIAAPMLRVSGPELVSAVCRAGAIGAFPAANARDTGTLDAWLTELDSALGPGDAPYCPNIIMRQPGLPDVVKVLTSHRTEIVVTSVGSPAPIVPALHQAGVLVFADVASVRHARRALEAGADGLVLLTAGAGGNTGWLNPLAFTRAVREFYDGPLALAGGITDGRALYAARVLGVDLGYAGTSFIATDESLADPGHKAMVAGSSMDDVLRTRAFTGMDASMLVPSIVAAGLDPSALDELAGSGLANERYGRDSPSGPRRWKDIWSAGHTVSGVRGVRPAAEAVEQFAAEYAAARDGAC